MRGHMMLVACLFYSLAHSSFAEGIGSSAGIAFARAGATGATGSFAGSVGSTDRRVIVKDGSVNDGVVAASPTTLGADGTLTLPDDAYISSLDATDAALVFRFASGASLANDTTALGAAGTVGWWASGTQGGLLGSNGLAPAANGTKQDGSSALAWDDTYSDDIYLQRTTATEGIIHGQGVTGDDELRLQIVNSSGQYDRWGFVFATAPGAAASITGTTISSAGITTTGRLESDDAILDPLFCDRVRDTAGTGSVWLDLGHRVSVQGYAITGTVSTNVTQYLQVATSGTFTLTLHNPSTKTGKALRIINAGAGVVTVTASSGNVLVQTVTHTTGVVTTGWNSDATVVLEAQGAGVEVIWDGTNWYGSPLGFGIDGS